MPIGVELCPPSARNPLERRTVFSGSARLVGAGRDRGDEVSAGGAIVAAFEAPVVVAGLKEVTVMGQPVEQRGCHLGVAEHAGPFSEAEARSSIRLTRWKRVWPPDWQRADIRARPAR